jgi:hypothetical protein
MKYVYLGLSWVFGVVFLLMGLVSLAETPKAGISLILISLFLLPPVRNFVYSKTKKEISQKHRTVAIFVLVMAFGVFVNQDNANKVLEVKAQEAKEQAEQIAKVRQENIDYFNANKDQIVSTAKNEFEAKNYNAVITASSKYLVAGDEELKRLHSLASTELAAIKKKEKTNKLLAKVKKIPASELENNNAIYKQLLALHPDNATYKKKVDFYTTRIKEEEDKRLLAVARKENIERQFSAWDGSHAKLERIIKEAMNDPDSYEHDKTVYWDRGDHLVVQTTYRGKNAFGGTVRNFLKAKVSLSGQVLQILDQT